MSPTYIEAIDCTPHRALPRGVSIDLHNSAHRKFYYTMFDYLIQVSKFPLKRYYLLTDKS